MQPKTKGGLGERTSSRGIASGWSPFTNIEGTPALTSGVVHPAALSRGRWAGVPNEEGV